jgi:hypothetical protein
MLDGGVGGDGGAVEDMRDGIGRHIGLGAEFEQAGDDGADGSLGVLATLCTAIRPTRRYAARDP